MAQTRHPLTWQPPVPGQVMMLCGKWDLRRGDHPSLAGHLSELATYAPFPAAEEWQALSQLELPLALTSHGHHLVQDTSYLHAANPRVPDEWPLAPMLVRDLAGRVIHTGLLPLPSPPAVPLFPMGCADVTAQTPGAGLIENAIFTAYRRLEIAAPAGVPLAGQPELQLRAVYPQPMNYPFKLRPDTFYQDGWRLPQVPRLFARPALPQKAEEAAQELMARWHKRPAIQDYETFYETNGAEQWFEQLFLNGVTVIPTLEAYNGRYHVAADYSVEGVDPGRAIPGLHQAISQRASELPPGTILEVIQPGYVTATQVFPAQVVVSDGSAHQAPQAPLPMLPNLQLPHPRVSSKWGAVWLPTHPAHFAEPALWDWDTSGHFVQISGPLWDPVHYTYASTQTLVRACRRAVEGNPGIFVLPEALKTRFSPIVEQSWYDTINERTAQERAKNYDHPLHTSALDSLPLGQRVAPIGYHPLPLALEYELDPAVFPHLHPRHRVEACPPEFSGRLAPVATPVVETAMLAKHHVVVTEPLRETLEAAARLPLTAWWGREANAEGGNPVTRLHLFAQLAPAWLPEAPLSQLFVNVKRLFANRAYRQALQKQSATLPAALFRFREAGLAWRRLRYRLFTKYPAIWVQAWAQGLELSSAENALSQTALEHHEQVRQARARSITVVAYAPKGVPANAAAKLRFKSAASKLPSTHKQPRV